MYLKRYHHHWPAHLPSVSLAKVICKHQPKTSEVLADASNETNIITV